MTSEPRRSASRVVRLVALPLLSGASVAWWRTGEQLTVATIVLAVWFARRRPSLV